MSLFWILILFIVIGLVYKYQKDKKKQAITAENQTEPTKKKSHKSLLITVGIIILFGMLINSSLNSAREKAELAREQAKEKITKEQQTTPIETETIELSDEDEILLIKTNLLMHGIGVESAEVADGRANEGVKVLILSYKSSAPTAIKLAEESGVILGSYIGAAEGGWDIDELSVIVGDTQGNAIGMWYCSKEWTNDFVAGRMSMEELSANVLTTMTTF